MIFEDYGLFDPRFVGVGLVFPDHAMWDTFWSLQEAKRTGPNAVAEWGRKVLAKHPDDAFRALAIATSGTHETRHYHDSLLSPYGQHLARLRMSILVHGLQVVSEILTRRQPVAVPVPTWTAMGRLARQQQLDFWLHAGGEGLTVDDFYVVSEERRELLEYTAKAYSAIEAYSTDTSEASSAFLALQPFHLLEASAIGVQLQEIWSAFGVDAYRLFLDRISKSGELSDYGRALWIADEFIRSLSHPLPKYAWHQMVAWSLLGDFWSEGDQAQPSYRLKLLMGAILEGAIDGRPELSSQEAFEYWSDQLGLTPVEQALAEMAQRNADMVEESLVPFGELGDGFRFAERAFREVVRQARELTESFLADPDTYVMPDRYIDEDAGWPPPDLRFVFQSESLVGKRSDLEAIFEVRRAVELADDHIGLLEAYPRNTLGANAATAELREAFDAMCVCDFVFGHAGFGDVEREFGRFVLRESGLPVFSLM